MTAAEDAARAQLIAQDPLAQVIHDAIEALPHARRLYPDLYALEVAQAIRERLPPADLCDIIKT